MDLPQRSTTHSDPTLSLPFSSPPPALNHTERYDVMLAFTKHNYVEHINIHTVLWKSESCNTTSIWADPLFSILYWLSWRYNMFTNFTVFLSRNHLPLPPPPSLQDQPHPIVQSIIPTMVHHFPQRPSSLTPTFDLLLGPLRLHLLDLPSSTLGQDQRQPCHRADHCLVCSDCGFPAIFWAGTFPHVGTVLQHHAVRVEAHRVRTEAVILHGVPLDGRILLLPSPVLIDAAVRNLPHDPHQVLHAWNLLQPRRTHPGENQIRIQWNRMCNWSSFRFQWRPVRCDLDRSGDVVSPVRVATSSDHHVHWPSAEVGGHTEPFTVGASDVKVNSDSSEPGALQYQLPGVCHPECRLPEDVQAHVLLLHVRGWGRQWWWILWTLRLRDTVSMSWPDRVWWWGWQWRQTQEVMGAKQQGQGLWGWTLDLDVEHISI